MKTKFTLLMAGLLALTACSGNGGNSDSSSSGNSQTTESETVAPESSQQTESSKPEESSKTETETAPDTSTETTVPPVETETQPGTSTETTVPPVETETETQTTTTPVPEVQKVFVKSFTEKASLTSFERNKSADSKFLDKEVTYKIGDDNAFNFKPNVVSINKETAEEKDEPNWKTVLTLSVYENDAFVEVGERFNDFVEGWDDVAAAIDFKQESVGKTFKLTYQPEKLTDKQLTNPNYTKELIVEVCDGYNVYDVNELAYINNGDQNLPYSGYLGYSINQKVVWDAFKTAKGLKTDYVPAGVYLHDDFKVTTANFPAEFLLTQEHVNKFKDQLEDAQSKLGLLLDGVEIYTRNVASNEKFVISGNYFTINASQVPVVGLSCNNLDDKGKAQISHAALFRVDGPRSASTVIENIKTLGNAGLQENQLLAGGLIMEKVSTLSHHVYNNIAVSWFISYFPEHIKLAKDDTRINLVEKCVATDAYNCFVYNWGSDVTLKDCNFYGAGGPCIIQDHLYLKDHDRESVTSSTTAIDCKLQSYVAGTEGWFDSMNASGMAAPIKALDALFNALGRSFIYKSKKTGSQGTEDEVKMFNMVLLNKDGSMEGPTANPAVRGSFKVANTLEAEKANNYEFNYFANDPVKSQVYPVLAGQGAPVFETNGGGAAWTDGKNAFVVDGAVPPHALAENPQEAGKVAAGNYLSVYYSGMMIMMGYGVVGQEVPAK